jgi:putative endonuclease
MTKAYAYILTNNHHGVLYVGSTTDLKKCVYLHRSRLIAGFTKTYNVTKLVYFETFGDEEAALCREQQLKGGSRAKKIALIKTANSGWHDLYDSLK